MSRLTGFGLASDQGNETNVASSASSVSILALNANRVGFGLYNDSTQILYLLLGGNGTASSSNYTVQMPAGAYYEAPYMFQGIVNGIWASANGNARVTEFV